jgi:hypothetical protein
MNIIFDASELCRTVGGTFLHSIFLEVSKTQELQHLQEFAKFYLANLVFCQLLKRYAK